MTGEQIIELGFAKAMSAMSGARTMALNRALALAAINEGLHKIETAGVWEFLEAEETVTSTPENRVLVSPSDLSKTLLVWDTAAETRLDYFDDRQGVLPLSDRGQVPHMYSEWNGEIRLWPTPTAARDYLVRYYAKMTELSAESDEPVLPEMFHDLLVSYVAYYLTLRAPSEGQRFLPASAAQPFLLEWQEGLNRMLASPFTMKSLDRVPWHEHAEMVVDGLGTYW